MATFVLVHGAMHGGWCWGPVRRLLTARGHDVYVPTLRGQGERRAEVDRTTGVGTHVADLEELLWFEDLDEVHLVLHSYAGVLAGPVADRAARRLASVVFLGAFMTGAGQSLSDVEPPEVAERYRRLAGGDGAGWLVPASEQFLDQWGVTDAGLRSWVGPRLTDFPLRCVTEPTTFDPAGLADVRKVYVAHTEPPLDSLAPFYAEATAAGWETHELAYGHDMMLVAPEATATLLEQIAAGPAAAGAVPSTV